MSTDEAAAKKEAEALVARLNAQFGNVDFDLKMLGINDEDEVAKELAVLEKEEEEEEMKQQNEATMTTTSSSVNNADADAAAQAAAALMARLGEQFGDLDMTQLGLGGVGGSGGGSGGEPEEIKSGEEEEESQPESEESSLAEPTQDELDAWQAAQFSKGQKQKQQKEKETSSTTTTASSTAAISINKRRLELRKKREQQLLEQQIKLRGCQQKEDSSVDIVDNNISSKNNSVVDNILNGETSTFFSSNNNTSSVLLLNELISNEIYSDSEILQTSWKRLYASYEQGLGFWNLWNCIMGYNGPTIMIIRCIPSISKTVKVGRNNASSSSSSQSQNQNQHPPTACIGFYTTTPWIESSEYFGGGGNNNTTDSSSSSSSDSDKAFLFSIDESSSSTSTSTSTSSSSSTLGDDSESISKRVKFYPIKDNEDRPPGGYMYCRPSTLKSRQKGSTYNSSSSSSGVNGIGIGGKPTQPRLHLTENFEDCRCLTYDSSRITQDGDLFDNNNTNNNINNNINNNNTDNENNNRNDNSNHPFAQSLYYFDINEIEIWGVGGNEWIQYALKEQELTRKVHIKQYQTIDRKMMWNHQSSSELENNHKKS